MRILLINTSERTGGAAIAANRLMQALKRKGRVKARMLVRDKQTDRLAVVGVGGKWTMPLRFLWERLAIYLANGLSRKNLFQVDFANAGVNVTKMSEFKRADVIHLHWVNQGFLSLSDLDALMHSGKPVVITMHDQWYYTAICHYAGDCDKYVNGCSKCDMLRFRGGLFTDVARRVFERKQKAYAGANLTFVGCSKWIADMASRSLLTDGSRVTSVANAIDTDLFCPMDRMAARMDLALPADKHVLLFGCQRITDERKGFKYLVEAFDIIAEENPELAQRIVIAVVGGASDKVRSLVPFNIVPIPYLNSEEQMVKLYNAVDLYVTPSLQDNLPNTIVEAMACGVPCVGFRVGGIPEMIDHKLNGYVADYCDARDFARGIEWGLSTDRQPLEREARRKALDTYSEAVVAEKYIAVYREALKRMTNG